MNLPTTIHTYVNKKFTYFSAKKGILYVHPCMLPIAGQTAGPIGLTLFVDTHGWLGGVVG